LAKKKKRKRKASRYGHAPESPGERKGNRVVIADDDGEMRALLRCWLEAEGFEVDEVDDGVALVEYLVGSWMDGPEQSGLRLMVTDQRMPGFVGTRVIESFRLIGENLPVLLVTAFPEPADVEHALALGVFEVLTKPVEKDRFLAVVQAALGQQR